MFFVFPFLLITIYVSEINNFILKTDRQGDGSNGKRINRDLVFEDVQKTLPALPTRKSVFHLIQNLTKTQRLNSKLNKNNKLSDEVPIKRHIQENDEEDVSSMFRNTKSSTTTSRLELKRKWPVVELHSETDDFKRNSHYFDEFEKKQFSFIHDVEKESKMTDLPPKLINNYSDLHTNHSNVKPVGLRSLPQQEFPGISCEDGDTCVCRLPGKGKTSPKCSNLDKCTRTTIVYSLANFYMPYEIFNTPKNIPTGTPRPATATKVTTRSKSKDMGVSIGIPMGVPMGMPSGYLVGYPPGYPAGYLAGYPAGYPMAIPAAISASPISCTEEIGLAEIEIAELKGSHSFCQTNTNKGIPRHKKPCETQSDDYLYYDDDDDDDELDKNDKYNENDSMEKKRKHDRKHKDDILYIDIGSEESHKGKLNQISKHRDNQDTLAIEILNDLQRSYSDTVIKNCYCGLASSYGMNVPIAFLWLILIMFC